jgi:F-type H+-transporting ATPase subunit delta
VNPGFQEGRGTPHPLPSTLRWIFLGLRRVCLRARSAAERLTVANEPIVSGMAGRYATALFDLALEQRALDAVKADLDRFDAMIDESADLNRLVRSPVFTAEEQKNALAAILEKAGIGGTAANFLRLVAQKRRLFAVREMVRAFRAFVARHKGETRAEVTVAEPLSENHLNALKAALKSTTKKEVALDIRIDPAILGGLIVKLGSRMVDASLKTKLNSIKLAMKEAQ